MKYIKRPIPVDVIQIKDNPDEIMGFMGPACEIVYKNGRITHVMIHTLEGDMRAENGDYIIKGIKGEFYPCRRYIFEETYVAYK